MPLDLSVMCLEVIVTSGDNSALFEPFQKGSYKFEKNDEVTGRFAFQTLIKSMNGVRHALKHA